MRRVDRIARALNVARADVMRGLELAWIVAACFGVAILVTLSRLVGLYAYRMRYGSADAELFESFPFNS